MVAYSTPDWRALIRARRLRAEDEDVRRTMGLQRIGLVWSATDWRAEPRELYVACDGVEYVKVAPTKYVKRVSLGATMGWEVP